MRKLLLFSAALLLQFGMYAQSISGRVTNQNTGEALPGASISLKFGKYGVTSDVDGYYNLSLTNKSGQELYLEVSFIGFTTQSKTISLEKDSKMRLNVELVPEKNILNPVNISALRVGDKTPVAHSNMSKADIEAKNEGRDVPFLLKDLPSTVVNSDAGAGIGYTNIRIRGSDISRINVTINGVPLNDPEGHGVFWVNTPDLSTSTESIQVQRGVGTSTNGSGAFGASINLQTNSVTTKPYAISELSGGSFNTLKRNINIGSGLLNNHWSFEGRLSKITSDGFIDRATSDLTSYYLSGSYYSEKTSVQLIHFAGHERTYQAWNGIPEAKLNGDTKGIDDFLARNFFSEADANNLRNSDSRTYNFYTYENEVDDYAQDHYQLHLSHRFNSSIKANASLHYTYGRGYFEQYKNDDDLADYNIPSSITDNDTITSSDLIRQRWLDNHFYGGVYSLEYNTDKLKLTLGGAYNEFHGDHFGEVIWARFASNSEINERYYESNSVKKDFNVYLKGIYDLGKFSLFGDLQYRTIDYTGKGIDNDLANINIDGQFSFFNPKGGINYQPNDNNRFYLSAAVGRREPVRNDFIDAITDRAPKAEKMVDYEFGYEYRKSKLLTRANAYYMDYTDQLVLTGELNDVGSAVRTNVDKSYRAGLELEVAYQAANWLTLGANANLSQNKILDYQDLVINYDAGAGDNPYVVTEFSSTSISFSPDFIGGVSFEAKPTKDLKVLWNSKYVGRQYLDNTESESKSLDAFSTTDLRFEYSLHPSWLKSLKINLLVANLFNAEYEPNGYTYSYIAGGSKITENFYYPMAGTNFLVGIKFGF